MKRFIALLMLSAFIFSLVGISFGKTLEEEKTAIREYLNVLDTKILKYKKQGNAKKVKQLQAEKRAMLKRWDKTRGELIASEAVVSPLPPSPPPPPPPPKIKTREMSKGKLGWGIEASLEFGMIGGLLGLTANVVLPDPMKLGAMVGLPEDSTSYKVGLGYVQGNDINNSSWKAVPILFDGVVTFPVKILGHFSPFVGAGVNYVVYRSAKATGSYGGQVYIGAEGDLGWGGKTFGEVGYSILRTGRETLPDYSSRSFSVVAGQKILF
ncbi:hypothetical protein A2526_05465 [candidate division WOR-1 bacterium RIFOXYD2_FULL_36_8]|uniref:Outer membrane protein beta-barrel domain-containing protein n=1 Tax=candidate division WOR-1 bacterium RIFOXYB2_FULL_36_35 TaxID=1802578 RepID=A0A1F4S8T0_UNCSA|nr:MAG: hypothetical protein A2230_07400 [candidate division WOR-1 bacterium RIFOXYA2_FULL_36_21]OGC16811.1 MAG: hypothetical protein A2290_08000 [candidate division WOR-1 bacterium RIFOXYB2_FULL_36_35]OGC19826.1 MAG: hypothetical protein A2282_01150 [candidate division WOR-1 bacterium RIFOXYA12_FULL_36_13]OGC37316.1 MAG: hypothetical protein A2526_05465 [candidate division WOR-1 bacterium RIFOXYD2_FULL_36_8]